MKSTTQWTHHDDDFDRDYTLDLNYRIDDDGRIYFEWTLQEIVDWSFDSKHGVSLSTGSDMDGWKVIQRWLAKVVERYTDRIEAAIRADYEMDCEAAADAIRDMGLARR